MNFLKTLLALVLVFAAIVPVLTRGAHLIAAFMTGRDILRQLGLTVVALLALVLAVAVAAGLSGAGQQLWAAVLLAALPWAAHKASDWFIARPKPPQQDHPP